MICTGELSDLSAPFSSTMPARDDLAARVAAKGIGDGTRVVLYARQNTPWAMRVWWMLRAIGFDDAALVAFLLQRQRSAAGQS